ncbi:hypothetical protein [Acidithrix sp. C25]|uniref:hypothetical protein n=1 Tax=Acidithrix sp. C25 TaxID=1671482 RepID=UPI00191B9352|nr:hypothetical protein [Acidithrix sp. C25]
MNGVPIDSPGPASNYSHSNLGMPKSVPPPRLPLGFFSIAALALFTDGILGIFLGSRVVDNPMGHLAIGMTHMFMLGVASMAVLGAMHQFIPVISGQKLRHPQLSYWGGGLFAAGSIGLATSFLLEINPMVVASGILAVIGVILLVINLSKPLMVRGKGISITGARISSIMLVAVACFGITYAVDRNAHESFFALSPNLVIAHAHIGILGWLGISYVAVSEKLWPMFMLSHRKSNRSSQIAIWGLAIGVTIFVIGMLASSTLIATAAGVIIVIALCSHLYTLARVVSGRRRKLELLQGYVVVSAIFLVGAIGFAIASVLSKPGSQLRTQLAAAEIVSLGAWIALAVIGHAHKVVPFITWGTLRASGVKFTRNNKPLVFSDLLNPSVARASFVIVTSGFTFIIVGLATMTGVLFSIGSAALALAAISVSLNLAIRPSRMLSHFGDASQSEAG